MQIVSNQRPSQREVNVHFFDAVASTYEDWAGGLRRRVAARLVELVAPRPGEDALDAGCGTGLVANAVAGLVQPGGNVIGIDVSPRMLERARHAAPANVVYQLMPAEEPWFRDASFDLVTYGDSLAYLDDPTGALRHCHRVLRPGGRVGASLRLRSLRTAAQEAFDDIVEQLVHNHPLTLPEADADRSTMGEHSVVRELLEAAGFVDVRTTTMVTGARVAGAEAWVALRAGAGPRPHALISTLGPRLRRRLVAEVEERLLALGEDSYHYHEAFTFAVASRP